MKKALKGLVAGLLALSLTACQGVSNEQAGQLVGAGVGALAGSQFGSGTGKYIAIAVGTLAGYWVGGQLGRRLDERDRDMMYENSHDALDHGDDGDTYDWHNDDTGHYGSMTPTSTYQTDGETCRAFDQSVTVGDETEARTGTACQQDDGSWQIGT